MVNRRDGRVAARSALAGTFAPPPSRMTSAQMDHDAAAFIRVGYVGYASYAIPGGREIAGRTQFAMEGWQRRAGNMDRQSRSSTRYRPTN